MATERGTAPEGTEEEVVNQHYIIADNLRHKAFYEDAIDEYQRALCAQEPELGAESPAVGYTHYGLGLSFRALKEYKQAMVHLKAAATIFEGAVQKLKASETNGSGTANSKVDGQIDTLYQAMKKCKISLARAYHSNGVDLQRNGQYDKSILEHRKAVAIRENILGRSHLETARSYYVMGCALSDRGDFDEALSELRRSLRSRLLVFGKDHMDVKEVVMNIGTVLYARGGRMSADQIVEYKMLIIDSVKHENEGDTYMRKQQYEDAMASYRTAIALEQQCLGDLHPTTTDLYLRMADCLTQVGDLQASLVEYKSAITIYERMMGKFHIKMGNIYNKLAGVLMEKGEYETALSFYAKTYTIMDTTLGIHDDTKQALDNIKLAAEKARGGKSSVDLLLKAEEEFKKRHPSLNADSETESDDDKNGKKKSGADTKKSSTSTKGSKTATSIVKQEEEADII